MTQPTYYYYDQAPSAHSPEKKANWFQENKRMIAVALLITGSIALVLGLGLVIGAATGGSLIGGTAFFTWEQIFISTSLTSTGQLLIGGLVTMILGGVATSVGASILASTSKKPKNTSPEGEVS